MRNVLIINRHEYTRYVAYKGMGWSRDDLDSSDAERTMDGRMHRDRITTKRNLTYKLVDAPEAILAQLDDDLSEETFSMTYRDLHGVQTREFYCSSFKATLNCVDEEGTGDWGDAAFNVHEV